MFPSLSCRGRNSILSSAGPELKPLSRIFVPHSSPVQHLASLACFPSCSPLCVVPTYHGPCGCLRPKAMEREQESAWTSVGHQARYSQSKAERGTRCFRILTRSFFKLTNELSKISPASDGVHLLANPLYPLTGKHLPYITLTSLCMLPPPLCFVPSL